METVKKIAPSHIDEFRIIVINAYLRFSMLYEKEASGFYEMILRQNEDPSITLIGYYREDTLLVVMRLHDCIINFHGRQILAGGIGLVGVDLLNRKEKVAKMLMHYFHTCPKG